MSLKNEVLKRLEENRGEYISGEKLSAELCVTRQAVWKAIKALEEQGYAILKVTNKGYMLDKASDLLSSAVIAEKVGIDVFCFDSVTSTNDVAKAKFIELKKPVLVVADYQTHGKRKNGEIFISPKSKGVYMSVALNANFAIDSTVEIRQKIASTVRDCIEKSCDKCHNIPQLMSVDEIFIDDKKVCGILTEAEFCLASERTESVVVGVGIYTSEVGETLGHIESQEPRNALIVDVCKAICALFDCC